ncbi:MAG: RNA polymerase sigma-70 factor [Bacteroidota bacterium]|nr:RNA polymerase sigma-70 factor [Bacteroidota bacterium]
MERINEIPYFLSTEDLYGEFFEKNYHVACLVANRYVNDIELSEDLVQDVFVTLWKKRKMLQETVNLKNYLLTAVRNHSLNVIQRNKVVKTSLSLVFDDLTDENNVLDYNKEEMAVKILHAINELPPKCKEIFNLAYQQGLSYQEIADELSISKNSVKTQMGIAYRYLKSKLSPFVLSLV